MASKKNEDWRTPGPRDFMDNPVMMDACGHEVLDFDRMRKEGLHPNSPETRAAYAEYDRMFAPRLPRFITNLFSKLLNNKR